MASRNHQAVVSQQQKGGVVPMGKQKATIGADGKNRRALGDIGNVVNLRPVEGKPQPQINRPITRSFGAQLLAKAQAEIADKKLKEQKALAIPNGGGKGCAKPMRQQKVSMKSKAETVVNETKPEAVEECKNPSPAAKTSVSRSLTKKKVHTLTSVLTARSKAACGLVEKPKNPVLDIDASDRGNQLAVVEYIEDIYKFYKLAEQTNRPCDYLGSQLEINAKMRAILADWLIEVHNKFELMPETLYLTFYIIDRYLSLEMVPRRELQLLGVSAMLIASKYEEIWAPEVNDFILIADRAYTREQILVKEKAVLNKLEWNLTVPTPYMFLVRFIKAGLCDKEIEHMVFFFAELSLMQYPLIIERSPSLVAASAVLAARCTFKKKPLWNDTLRSYTGYTESQLMDCAKIMVKSHQAASESKLKVVYNKYSNAKLGAVAMLPPAMEFLQEMKASLAK